MGVYGGCTGESGMREVRVMGEWVGGCQSIPNMYAGTHIYTENNIRLNIPPLIRMG